MLERIKCFLLDMDGTIYLGNDLIPGAKEFLQKIKESGRDYIFMTNNSSKNIELYQQKMKGLGVDAEKEEFFTSGSATISYINQRKENANVYLLGTEALEQQFTDAGVRLETERDKKIDYVVLGFDTTLTYDKIWTACDYILDGVEFIATHPDLNCPLAGGKQMPDTGSMIKMFEAATGVSPKIIGKPNKGVIEVLMKKFGYSKEELVMVGDRLYTDIQMGINSGIDSILVLSGETKREDYENNLIEPTHVFDSVDGITKHL